MMKIREAYRNIFSESFRQQVYSWRKRILKPFKNFLKLVYRLLFARINLIDVGSIGGLPHPWKAHSQHIRYLLSFEPREQQSLRLFKINSNCALWESDGERELYIYKGFEGSGTSLFKQNNEYVRENIEWLSKRGSKYLADTWFDRSEIETIEKVYCRSLDNVLSSLSRDISFNFLKIDAQGAEYEILSGAENFLQNHCRGLHLELFVLPLYKDIHLLPDVVQYLERFNFELVKKFPAHGSFDSQHDCVFLKKGKDDKATKVIRDIYEI